MVIVSQEMPSGGFSQRTQHDVHGNSALENLSLNKYRKGQQSLEFGYLKPLVSALWG